MDIKEFKKIVTEIVAQADTLKRKFVKGLAPINYACIFCQNDEEYDLFINLAKKIGRIVQETKAGPVFQIEPLQTIAGYLQLLKIRKPDSTRPERGDADFTLSNYDEFKKNHLGQKTMPTGLRLRGSDSRSRQGFSLITKNESFEMIELVDPDFNVRVYFSNPPLTETLEIKQN